MITISIDLTKLDYSRVKPFNRQNGDKAEFLELILLESPTSQYGDYIVKQSVTKEERMAGKEMPILGDGKIYKPQERERHPSRPPAKKQQREVF